MVGKIFGCRWKFAIALSLLFCILILLYFFNPVEYQLAPKCIVKMITGLSCPGCGMQRFLHALMHGHIYEAFSYNWFFVYAIPYTLLLVAARINLLSRLPRLEHALHSSIAVYFYLISYFVWFIVRNIFNI